MDTSPPRPLRMTRNELDSLLDTLADECRQRNLPVFRAQPIWDDENLTTVAWKTDDRPDSWREFLSLVESRRISMLLLIAHSFHESVFDPTPLSYRMNLDPEMRAEVEEQEQMLAAARQFSGQTGRVEMGWIDNGIFYVWGQETDWYSRVWELVMSRAFDPFEDDE